MLVYCFNCDTEIDLFLEEKCCPLCDSYNLGNIEDLDIFDEHIS